MLFNSFAMGYLGETENKSEKQQAQQPQKNILTYSFPKSEPNLQSAFVFPRGDSGHSTGTAGEEGK